MRKVYYTLMKRLTLIGTFIIFGNFVAVPAIAQQPAALRGASLESHDGMTISALPWTDPALYKTKFSKKSPFASGVLAIQVDFRNDSDEAIKIDLTRIRLSVRIDEENQQQLARMNSDDVADATLKVGTKDPTKKRNPLPLPLPRIGVKTGKDKNWQLVQREAQDAGIPTNVVAPHSTVEGLLYFDIQGQLDLLSTARLYVPDMVFMSRNQALLYFEIDLSRPGKS
jgi:hypothetical protein